MRRATLCDIWAATPKETVVHGEVVRTFERLRQIFGVNLQTDYSELDAETYGSVVNEMLRARLMYVPDLAKGDHVYLRRPNLHSGDGRGDYEVIAIKPGYCSRLRRNPTVIDLRKVTK